MIKDRGSSSFPCVDFSTCNYYIIFYLLTTFFLFSGDLWALGCIVYQMLIGFPPFYGSHEFEIFQKIRIAIFELKENQLFSNINWESLRDQPLPETEFIDKEYTFHLVKKNPTKPVYSLQIPTSCAFVYDPSFTLSSFKNYRRRLIKKQKQLFWLVKLPFGLHLTQ